MNNVSIIDPGRLTSRRGFVFIIALGAMAILTIVAATANLASLRGYRQTGRSLSNAQVNVLVQSSLDAIAAQAPAPLAEGALFEHGGGEGEQTINAQLGAIEELDAADKAYDDWGIAHQAGDIRFTLTITITPPNLAGQTATEKTVRRTFEYFWNPMRGLARPILIARGV